MSLRTPSLARPGRPVPRAARSSACWSSLLAVPQVTADQVTGQSMESAARSCAPSSWTVPAARSRRAGRWPGWSRPTSRPDLAAPTVVRDGYGDYAAVLGADGSCRRRGSGSCPTGSPRRGPPPCDRGTAGDRRSGRSSSGCPGAATCRVRRPPWRSPALDRDFFRTCVVARDAGRDPAARRHDGRWPRADETPGGVAARRAVATGWVAIEVGDWLAQVGPPSRRRAVHGGRRAERGPAADHATTCSCSSCWPARWSPAALVAVVARGLSQPLTDLTEAAERVVAG